MRAIGFRFGFDEGFNFKDWEVERFLVYSLAWIIGVCFINVTNLQIKGSTVVGLFPSAIGETANATFLANFKDFSKKIRQKTSYQNKLGEKVFRLIRDNKYSFIITNLKSNMIIINTNNS